MNTKQTCGIKGLVSTSEGEVSRCRGGIYHVRINATTLHLTVEQFESAARLFKLALGMVAGRRSYAAPWEKSLETELVRPPAKTVNRGSQGE